MGNRTGLIAFRAADDIRGMVELGSRAGHVERHVEVEKKYSISLASFEGKANINNA